MDLSEYKPSIEWDILEVWISIVALYFSPTTNRRRILSSFPTWTALLFPLFLLPFFIKFSGRYPQSEKKSSTITVRGCTSPTTWSSDEKLSFTPVSSPQNWRTWDILPHFYFYPIYTLYYIILYYIILYYIILYYIVLYYIVLYYIVLYYIILYYILSNSLLKWLMVKGNVINNIIKNLAIKL